VEQLGELFERVAVVNLSDGNVLHGELSVDFLGGTWRRCHPIELAR
jgi:hypothetical protein